MCRLSLFSQERYISSRLGFESRPHDAGPLPSPYVAFVGCPVHHSLCEIDSLEQNLTLTRMIEAPSAPGLYRHKRQNCRHRVAICLSWRLGDLADDRRHDSTKHSRPFVPPSPPPLSTGGFDLFLSGPGMFPTPVSGDKRWTDPRPGARSSGLERSGGGARVGQGRRCFGSSARVGGLLPPEVRMGMMMAMVIMTMGMLDAGCGWIHPSYCDSGRSSKNDLLTDVETLVRSSSLRVCRDMSYVVK